MQTTEFDKFNGAILLTTNCLVPPKKSYADRVFTTGAVGYPNYKHIDEVDGKKDFTPLIELAKTLPAPTELETDEIVGGFAHEQVFALADKVVDAVKSGAKKNLSSWVNRAQTQGSFRTRRREQIAHCVRNRLARTKGSACFARFVISRREKYSSRTDAPRIPQPKRCQSFGREFWNCRNHDR